MIQPHAACHRAITWLVLLAGTGVAAADPQSPDKPAVAITGTANERFAELDQALVDLIETHDLPGISLAISEHGQIVHARGYGLADRELGTPVTPASRFRIASVSKPITAVAILRLVEMGKLRLNDRVFDILDRPAPLQDNSEPDPRLNEVTIEQLLQHRGGWDRDQSFDPMFRSVQWAELCRCPPPAMPHEVIRAMHTEKLDFDPGQRYAYSNFGYCLLGRVIEKVTGLTYDQFVHAELFQPVGITSIALGRTRLEQRQTDEVRYYHPDNGNSVFAADVGQIVPSPYGAWCLEAMDAHGGWIASASDLVRFLNALPFDDSDADDSDAQTVDANRQSLLARSTAELITLHPLRQDDDRESYYGLGWSIRRDRQGKFTIWHTGSLPGTATELTRRSDGRCFAVLINSRSGQDGKNPLGEVTGAIHRVLNALDAPHQE